MTTPGDFIGAHRRNPPIGMLRAWAVYELGWTNRRFKRTPLRHIKTLWRRHVWTGRFS